MFKLFGKKIVYIDISSKNCILATKDNRDDRVKYVQLPANTFTCIVNGQVKDTEIFLKELSCLKDAYIQNTLIDFVLSNKNVLSLISRHKLSPLQKEILQNAAAQVLFDECKLLTHEEMLINFFLCEFGESYKEKNILRIYDEEIVANTISNTRQKLEIYPDLFVFALKDFLEKKYRVSIRSKYIHDTLLSQFAINPKNVGKRKIKYKIATENLQNDTSYIEPDYSEVAEAVRPISKAALKNFQLLSQRSRQNEFYFYSSVKWMTNFLLIPRIDCDFHFVDINRDESHFFIKRSLGIND